MAEPNDISLASGWGRYYSDFLEVRVDPARLAELQAELASIPGGVQRVLVRAVNKVGVAARAQIVRAVCQEVNLKPSDVRGRNVSVKRANYSSLEARVKISGKRIPLKYWGANEVSKGITYAIRRGSRRLLAHAFKATMSSGHVGVMARRTGIHAKAAKSKKRRGRWPGAYPIVKQFGPSVPQVVSNIEELSRQVLDEQLAGHLAREVDTQLGLALQRRGGFQNLPAAGEGGD